MTECKEHNQKGSGMGYASTTKNGKSNWMHRYVYCEANNVTIESIKGYVVRHKCDNPRCINPDHLELGTHEDNMRDMTSRGRQAKGVDQGAAKLTDDDIRYIRKHYVPKSKHHNQYTLAKKFNVHQLTISRILRGLTWSHVKQDED